MRFISHIGDNLVYRNDGTVAHVFSPQGILTVGSNTTRVGAGNDIDAAVQSPTSRNLQLLYPTDLDGATTERIERVGLGTLTQVDRSGATLTNLVDGYKRLFFEAPLLATGTNVPNIAGIKYIVIRGTAIYNGVTYGAGDEFESVGSGTVAVTGSGTYALSIPDELRDEMFEDRFALFKEALLLTGSETRGWDYNNDGGFIARDSADSTSVDFFGFEG